MTIIEFSEYLEQKAGLLDLGFLPKKKWNDREVMVYHRNTGDRTDVLSLSIYWYSQSKKENGIFIGYQDIPKGVFFPVVIKIFEEAKIELLRPFWYDKENYNTYKIISKNHPNWKKPLNKYPSISENLLAADNELDEKKAEEACQILQKIIEKQILPFYDLYPSLQSVNDEIIDCYEEPRELVKYISGLMPFNKMVVMHECNNPRYCDYIEEYERQLQKAISINKEKYYPTYQFYKNLVGVLENRNKREEKRTDNQA